MRKCSIQIKMLQREKPHENNQNNPKEFEIICTKSHIQKADMGKSAEEKSQYQANNRKL